MSSDDPATGRAGILSALSDAGRELSTAMVLFHTNLAARLDLGPSEIKVLELVARHGTVSPKALRESTGMAAASITGVLDRLEAKRFVERRPDPHDGRGVEVVHTPRHTELVRELFTGLMAANDAIHARYDTEQLALLAGYLQAVADAQQRAAIELGRPPPPGG